MTPTAPTPPRHRWYADLCLATTAIIWGINIPVFKHAMGQLDPWVFNATRLVAATITLAQLPQQLGDEA
jgi:drug/metabolite transporter (DMT)-like permease